MNTNLTDVTIILDRSGSMAPLQGDTIGSFNGFIEEQRKLPGECRVTLATFSDATEIVYSRRPVGEVPRLTTESYRPGGNTALLDAIGSTLASLGRDLDKTHEEQRPGKVLVVIITDGEENASRRFSQTQIAEAIRHQREKYSWEFVFLGANQDSFAVAKRYAIPTANAMNYVASEEGVQHVMRSLGSAVAAYRSGSSGSDFFSNVKPTDEA